MRVSPGDREHFEEHGWLVLRGAVGAHALADLRRACDAMWQRFGAAAQTVGEDVVQLSYLCRFDTTLRAWVFGPSLGAAASAVLGCDAVRLLSDLLLTKKARTGGPVHWHQDYSYTRLLDRPRTVSVRLALDRESPETGAMEVLDGSHRWGLLLDAGARNWFTSDGALGTLPDALAAGAQAARRWLALEPGDVSFHHCLLWHASAPNGGATPRRTVVTHVFDGACVLRPEGLPEGVSAEQVATDRDGHLVGAEFPRLFPPGDEYV